DVEPGEPSGAARRSDRPIEHPHSRGLAGPVRAEQAEHLARRHVEVDPLDGLDPAGIRLAEPSDLDACLAFHFCLLGVSGSHIGRVYVVTAMTHRNERT